MTSKIVTLFICDYCKKKYQRENACIAHEELCTKNPANERACHTCEYLCKKDVDLYEDTYNGESVRQVNVLFCSAKGEAVYTPQTQAKGNAFDFGYEPANEPMPKHCDKRKSSLLSDYPI